MSETFTCFWHGPFSQWHPSSFQIGDLTFSHAEQFMMYAKAMLFGDRDVAQQILAATTPKEQKALGRQVQQFDPVVWELFREGIVFTGNYAKFTQNHDLRELLVATAGTTLVEASPRDRIWGIGLGPDNPRCHDRSQWRGLNLLGKILTQVRQVIIYELKI